jgi:hypothetical protein
MPTAPTFRDLCLLLRDHGAPCHRGWEFYPRSTTSGPGYRCLDCDWSISYSPQQVGIPLEFLDVTFENLPRQVRSHDLLRAWLEDREVWGAFRRFCLWLRGHRCDVNFDCSRRVDGGLDMPTEFRCHHCGETLILWSRELPSLNDPLGPPFLTSIEDLPYAVRTGAWLTWLYGPSDVAPDVDAYHAELEVLRAGPASASPLPLPEDVLFLRSAMDFSRPRTLSPVDAIVLRETFPRLDTTLAEAGEEDRRPILFENALLAYRRGVEDALDKLYAFAEAHGRGLPPRPDIRVEAFPRPPARSRYERLA